MAKIILILFLFLSGCSSKTVPETSINALDAPESSVSAQTSVDHAKWSEEKQYIYRVASLDKRYLPNISEYSFLIEEDQLIIQIDNNTLTYVFSTQFLTSQRTDTFQYVKDGKLKQGTLTYRFDENNSMPIIYGTFSNETDTYPIYFNWDTMTIHDNEAGSKTLSKPMKFIKGLTNRITFEIIETYNQMNLQKQVLDEWYTIYSSIKTAEDAEKTKNSFEFKLDYSQLVKNDYFRKNIASNALLPRVISIGTDFFISLHDAGALEKTLFIASHLKKEFSSPEEINWNELLVEISGLSSSGGCEDLYCSIDKQDFHLSYTNGNGYLSLAHLDDLNTTVNQLSGLKSVYQPLNDQTLVDGALYDSDINGYILYAPDGEFVNRDPGIIILDQSTSGSHLTIEFVSYLPEIKELNYYVNDIFFGKVSDFSNENDKMQAAYDTVIENLDSFNHWKLTLEKQEDNQLYRLISMYKTN